MEREIMNNWKINNSENMIGDLENTEMEFYSTMPKDEKKSKVDDNNLDDTPIEEASEESDTKPSEESEDIPEDATEEIPVEINSEEEVEARLVDSKAKKSTKDEVADYDKTSADEIEMDPETAAKMAMQTKIVQATYTDIRNDLPEFRSGDTISVGYRVIEGNRSRIQSFDGVVIKISAGHGLDKTFTVRKISGGIGVERIFPFHSPNIESIKLLKEGKVRRAKLYYLRQRKGKATRIREKTQ